jgi:hypothetical protein
MLNQSTPEHFLLPNTADPKSRYELTSVAPARRAVRHYVLLGQVRDGFACHHGIPR